MKPTKTINALISCIIPVYNRETLIVECLNAVLAQTYREFEIIIVDDGSSDNTYEVITKFKDDYPDKIKAIQQNNLGPGAARQAGLNHAKGDYVQFLDSDDLIASNKFESFINVFCQFPDTEIAYCVTHHFNRESPDDYIVWKLAEHGGRSILPEFLVSRGWSTSTPIYKKILLDKAGKILPLSCEEDLEYDCRIGLQQPKIYFINKHLTDFRAHQGQRFSVNNENRKQQLIDQIIAREQIYQTILKSELPLHSKEVLFFARTAFLLARQSGEMGLSEHSKRALNIAQSLSVNLSKKDKLAMTVFKAIHLCAGTKKGSVLFNALYNKLHRVKGSV